MKRRLSLFDAVMIASGPMIGSGIFMDPAERARFLTSSSQHLFVRALGGVGANIFIASPDKSLIESVIILAVLPLYHLYWKERTPNGI